MDIEQVKILIDAIEMKSFSKAAEKCSYTPSAISHIADSIESELGVKILDRDYKGITLNKNGEALYYYLKAIVDSENELMAMAKNLKTKSENLVIGCYASVSKYLLPDLLKGLKQVEKNVQVSVAVCDTVEEMQKNNADVYFIEQASVKNMPNFNWQEVYEDEYVAVFPKNLFVGKKLLSKEDLASYPFIMPNTSLVKSTFESNLGEIINVTSTDDASIISMIENGFGVSVLPKLSLKGIKSVKTAKLTPPLKRVLGLSYNAKSKNTAIKKFINFITKK